MNARGKNTVRRWARGLSSVLFPEICVCCWREPVKRRYPVCPFCMESRFESARSGRSGSAGSILLPERVLFQHALWQFDKGGTLQDVLHRIKYEGMSEVARQLGERLGGSLRTHPLLAGRDPGGLLLLPVPLHPGRHRLRGFNQAEHIARGVLRTWPLPLAPPDAAVRTRNTASQTGMALSRRMANMKNAFEVARPEFIRGRMVLLVDDVFTTGATAFSLAACLLRAGAAGSAVVTVAQA